MNTLFQNGMSVFVIIFIVWVFIEALHTNKIPRDKRGISGSSSASVDGGSSVGGSSGGDCGGGGDGGGGGGGDC